MTAEARQTAGTPRLIVTAADAFAATAAAEITRVLLAAVAARGRASVALAGGWTPVPVYRRLAEARTLPWDRVEVFFGDERAVPPTDPGSNYGMAVASGFAALPDLAGRVHRMPADRPNLDEAAEDYAARLPARLDLIVLGIGEDGHIASLFPGSPALAETARKVVAVRGPKPPYDRLSVTPPVIDAARERIVLAAVARALGGPLAPRECPAQLARAAIWIVDAAAAARLGREDRR